MESSVHPTAAPSRPGPPSEERVAAGAPLRLPALDGLRGLAVMLVLLSHAAAAGILPAPGVDFRGCGRPGVFLFFVLSAFLLTRQFLEGGTSDVQSPRAWGRYAARRLLRIYPAYLAVTLLYLGTQGWSPRVFLEHVAMLRGERHFWTIPAEVYFYLVLPLVVVPLVALGRRPLVRLALVVAAGAATRWLAPPDYGGRPPDYRLSILPFVPIFLAGTGAAVVFDAWRRRGERERARWARGFDVLTVLCAAVLVLHAPAVWTRVSGEPVTLFHFHLEFDRFGLLWAGVLLGLLCGSGALRRPFEWPAVRWVGAVSYGTYLFHRLVLEQIVEGATVWPPPLGLALFLAGALAAGWASFRWIEGPFLRLAPAGVR